MDNKEFVAVLQNFERDVIIRGVRNGALGRAELVPVRGGKLAKQKFGRIVGTRLETELSLAIDYYGHLKKSDGFFAEVREATPVGSQARMLKTVVVHFASIKVEHVVELAPELVPVFPVLKRELLKKRGFK